MDRLAEKRHETCWAGILDEGDVLLIVNSRTSRILTAGLSVGSCLPASCAALGPDSEVEVGLCSIAVPIMNGQDRTIAHSTQPQLQHGREEGK